MLAGLLMWTCELLARLRLPHPSATEILRATRARRSPAYARRARLRRAVPALDRPPGRPSVPPPAEITHRMLCFLIEHPGAVCRTGTRRRYSASLQRFVLDLRAQFPDLDEAVFARAVQIPPGCLRVWRRRGEPRSAPQRQPSPPAAAVSGAGPAADVVRAYVSWNGSLAGFCEHVRVNLGIPWTRGVISRLLEEHGLRAPAARSRRRAESARGVFQTFFPGAQWVADGSELTVRVNGEPHRFNLELVVDTDSGAIAGASLRDCEDGRAVVDAFRDAVATTGTRPLSLLLDRRPCNLTDEVGRGIGDTARIYAGRGRPQSKGHVEGAFGLFAQSRPPLEITAGNQRELAQELLRLVVQCWARTLNHQPRRRRGGRSRVELWQAAAASPQQVSSAITAMRERVERQMRRHPGRRWARARGSRAFLAHGLARLGISDRDGMVLRALDDHPFEAVLAGLATYEGKRASGTLPESADGRYLIGIVRRIAEHDEGVHIAEALWSTRAAARAHLLRWLVETRGAGAPRRGPGARPDDRPEDIIDQMVDHALAAPTKVERRLWLAALAEAMRDRAGAAPTLYRRAIRRIHASPALAYTEQLACARALAAELAPMAA
jgi:hypothetical protein